MRLKTWNCEGLADIQRFPKRMRDFSHYLLGDG